MGELPKFVTYVTNFENSQAGAVCKALKTNTAMCGASLAKVTHGVQKHGAFIPFKIKSVER